MILHWLFIITFILSINKSLSCTAPVFSNLTVVSNFSLQNFLGRWYEIQWLPGVPHNESDIWRDYSQDFELASNVSQRLLVSGKARLINQEQCFSFGPWTMIANNSAKMILETKAINGTILNWPYYVLKVDYDNYALVYGCMLDNYTVNITCKEPILWIFSRTKTLSSQYSNMLDSFIETTLCVNLTQLEMTPQSEKSCYTSSALHFRHFIMNNMIFFNLLIVFLFLINK